MSLDRPVDSQRQPPSIGETLRAQAKEAESRGSDTVQRVMIGSKAYYVVIVRDGRLQPLPHDTERIQGLARVIVRAHTSSPSLAGKSIDHIHSGGAVTPDGQVHKHTEATVSQKNLHEATAGLSGKITEHPNFRGDSADDRENSQLTQSQNLVVRVKEHIATKGDTLTVKDLKEIIEIPNLPQEFKDEFSFLIHDKAPTDTLTQVELNTAFGTAYVGSDYDPVDFQAPFGGYLGRLIDEHKEGSNPAGPAFNSATYKKSLEDNHYDIGCGLYELNFTTKGSRTAQHAWNAMAKLALDVDHLSLQGIRSDAYLVPVESQKRTHQPSARLTIVSAEEELGEDLLTLGLRHDQERQDHELAHSLAGTTPQEFPDLQSRRGEYEEIPDLQRTSVRADYHTMEEHSYQGAKLQPPSREQMFSSEESQSHFEESQELLKGLLLQRAIDKGLLKAEDVEENEALSVDQLNELLLRNFSQPLQKPPNYGTFSVDSLEIDASAPRAQLIQRAKEGGLLDEVGEEAISQLTLEDLQAIIAGQVTVEDQDGMPILTSRPISMSFGQMQRTMEREELSSHGSFVSCLTPIEEGGLLFPLDLEQRQPLGKLD